MVPKALRSLVLSFALVVGASIAGCGLIPTASQPTQPPSGPAGPAVTSPAAKPAAVTSGSPSPAIASPPPSPSPSPSPSPIPRTTVRISAPSSIGGWIVDIADGEGYLAAQGIVLDRREADPGSATLAELVEKREADIGVVTTDRLVQVGRNGQSLIMVAGLVNKATYALIAARDVPDFGALKGKPVGHLDAESAPAAILKRILRSKSIPESESPLIEFPDPGVVGAAVANGTVGASLVDPPRAGWLRGSGFNVLIEASEVAQDFQAEGLVVRPEWARQNEDLLVRFIRATILAQRWALAPANKRLAVEQLGHSLGISPLEAGIVFEQYVEKLGAVPREADLDQAGVRGVVELLGEIDAAGSPRPDPARLADTTYVQRAKSSVPR